MERAAALPQRPAADASAAATRAIPKRRLKLVAAIAFAAVALLDWSRPPRDQWSVQLYDVAVIKSYRTLVHPITSKVSRCRFQPTCSRYSEEAMHAHGFPQGLALTLWRLLRCGPWVRPGTPDPVPN